MTPLQAAPAGGGILAVKPALLREPQKQACEPPKGMGDWWRGGAVVMEDCLALKPRPRSEYPSPGKKQYLLNTYWVQT